MAGCRKPSFPICPAPPFRHRVVLRRCAGLPAPPIGACRPRQILPGLLAITTVPLPIVSVHNRGYS